MKLCALGYGLLGATHVMGWLLVGSAYALRCVLPAGCWAFLLLQRMAGNFLIFCSLSVFIVCMVNYVYDWCLEESDAVAPAKDLHAEPATTDQEVLAGTSLL